MDFDSAAFDVNARATNDDVTDLVPVVVVVASLVSIPLAAVFLCLSRRKSTITPSSLLAFSPSWRHSVMLTIGPVFVVATSLPVVVLALIIVVTKGVVFVRISL